MRSFKEFQQPDGFQPHPAYEKYEAISTVGLITAHNPMGIRAGERQNFDSNGELLKDIKALGCTATTIRGMYAGHMEETFVVLNITEADILRLAMRHRQEAAIWGYCRHDEDGNPFFIVFYLDQGEAISQKRMDVAHEDVATKEAFIEGIKSGRVKIPNFTPRRNAVAVVPKEDNGDFNFNKSD